jgi:phosphate transport system permease protein
MTVLPLASTGRPDVRRGLVDRLGDTALFALTVVASLTVLVVIVAIIEQIVSGASSSISKFGIGFLGHVTWNPVVDDYGAASFIYGTAVTSAMALILAVPIGIAIGLFLSLLAPTRLAAVVGPLVELLAAIPSVVLGLWGLIVLAPILANPIEPWLNSALGWIPIFSSPSLTGLGMFNAGLILTIMVVPIIASISRELFVSVPSDLKEGALALGLTRWEMVRGVVLASTRPGLAATAILGLSRALGEAIAVTQVIGGGSQSAINTSLFANGDTLASRMASQFIGATSRLQTASLFYLAVILLLIGLATNLIAQLIVRRSAVPIGTAR